MPNINLPAPIGWNEWDLNRNVIPSNSSNSNDASVIVPDTPISPIYMPASAFWLRSLIDHCDIIFNMKQDYFSTFLQGGGTSGTITGSLNGMAVAALVADFPTRIDLGIGRYGSNNVVGGSGLSTGFTIGDKFKHQAWIRLVGDGLEGLFSVSDTLPITYYIELMQNYRLKKMYINHGEVIRYNAQDRTLTLDIDASSRPELSLFGGYIPIDGESLTIYKSNGQSVTVGIESITSNWDFRISNPGDITIESGDFYQMNAVWSIEDPFLLSGTWTGPENDGAGPYSGLNLYTSSHNQPYKEGRFLGIYIYEDSINVAINKEATEVSTFENPAPPPLDVLVPVGVGVPMRDVGDLQWAFYGFGNEDLSKIYDSDKRYKETYTLTGGVTYDQRIEATERDYTALMSPDNKEVSYFRLELSNGAWSDSHNWYAPCLQGSYLKNNGHLYKILAHPEALIIDVSKISVDGYDEFDPFADQDYSIVNQKAWTIIEHYDGYSGGSKRGIYEGKIVSSDISDGTTSVKIEVEGDSFVSWVSSDSQYLTPDLNTNNYVSRYRFRHEHLSGEPSRKYKKRFSWKLITNDEQNTYSIINITYPPSTTVVQSPLSYGEKYKITVEIKGKFDNLNGMMAYVCFDTPYDTVVGSRKSSSIELTSRAGIDGSLAAYIIANRICLDGEYFAPPYVLDIPLETRLGYTYGYLFGIGADGTSKSSIGEWLFITTPRKARGLASLFHVMRDEDWVVFEDSITKRMTIRRACLDYKEYPRKTEIVIGESVYSETVISSNNEIILDANQERLRRILVNVPDDTLISGNLNLLPALTFGIGNEDNYHGFVVSGDGVIDLQMLRIAGFGAGSIPVDTYTNIEGNKISPVYIYKKGQHQHLNSMSVDIAADTKNSPIYVNNGSIQGDVVIQYINDNQTLKDPGFFDIMKLADGEVLMLYGQKTTKFNLIDEGVEYLNNNTGSEPSNQWSNPWAVMAIGSFNDSYYWGAPSSVKQNMDRAPYATMLLNSVEYLSSLYDPHTQNLNIFVRAFRNNEQYIGLHTISVKTLPYKLFRCNYVDYNDTEPQSTSLSFMYRPPALPSDFVNDDARSWTDNDIIDYGASLVDLENVIKDQFIRVLGPSGVQAQVEYTEEFGIISTTLLPNGTYMLFFDSILGVRAIFSSNKGRTWEDSKLVYARDGRCGLLIGNYLFYVTTSGIEVKFTNAADYSAGETIARGKIAGEDVSVLEVNKQSELDSMNHFLIGSGSIDFQRLSGYTTSDGIVKIFFYNKNNVVVCMESKNGSQWSVADNF